ncbi:type II toxin-antitoxin system ParD family antitoxin [Iodidimonas sp. SYSU 1G8]|uniref:type II toxin-antitoxin system ParD family antitoxin n=1 Tax=Iodidimonas sp. SYSU 1G8 TaxID=3133967 RepID=UPI0031FF4025
MASMNVSLPEPLKAWVEAQAKTGRYANASDYVRDLIRRDQDRASKIDALQTLITEGIESGEARELDLPALLAKARASHDRGQR